MRLADLTASREAPYFLSVLTVAEAEPPEPLD